MNRQEEQPANGGSAPGLSGARARKVMRTTLNLVRRMGSGASELLSRLKRDSSPEGMIATFEESLAANARRREGLSDRIEAIGRRITARRQECVKLPQARRRIVEAELRSMLAEYKAGERELSVLLENERVLHQVKGRLGEMIAYGLAGLDEEAIDGVAMSLEDRVLEAEGRLDAARDLERSGRRRESDADHESLWDELAQFDEPLEEEPGEDTAGSEKEDSEAPRRDAREQDRDSEGPHHREPA